MADARALTAWQERALSEVTRRWETLPEVEHCPRCRGALPADVLTACSWCGVGATAAADTAMFYGGAVLDNQGIELDAPPPPAPPPAPPRLTWWERFARWPYA